MMIETTVRDARDALGLTQRALADALGIDVGTVSRWERGALATPKWAIAYLEVCGRCQALALELAQQRQRQPAG